MIRSHLPELEPQQDWGGRWQNLNAPLALPWGERSSFGGSGGFCCCFGSSGCFSGSSFSSGFCFCGGSGLGMHIVHSLVCDRLGGRIALESAPGKGVSITLLLPMRQAAN